MTKHQELLTSFSHYRFQVYLSKCCYSLLQQRPYLLLSVNPFNLMIRNEYGFCVIFLILRFRKRSQTFLNLIYSQSIYALYRENSSIQKNGAFLSAFSFAQLSSFLSVTVNILSYRFHLKSVLKAGLDFLFCFQVSQIC